MTQVMRTFLFAATLVSIASTATAQGTPEQQAACIDDAFRFCAAQIPDAKRIEACLEGHKSRLTPACRGQFDDPPPPPPKKARPRVRRAT
jgi:hypothetical protein